MDNIINPSTNEAFSIFSKEGKYLLKQFVKIYQSGGKLDVSKLKVSKECEKVNENLTTGKEMECMDSKKENDSCYRNLSLLHHPDKGGDKATFQKLNEWKQTCSEDSDGLSSLQLKYLFIILKLRRHILNVFSLRCFLKLMKDKKYKKGIDMIGVMLFDELYQFCHYLEIKKQYDIMNINKLQLGGARGAGFKLSPKDVLKMTATMALYMSSGTFPGVSMAAAEATNRAMDIDLDLVATNNADNADNAGNAGNAGNAVAITVNNGILVAPGNKYDGQNIATVPIDALMAFPDRYNKGVMDSFVDLFTAYDPVKSRAEELTIAGTQAALNRFGIDGLATKETVLAIQQQFMLDNDLVTTMKHTEELLRMNQTLRVMAEISAEEIHKDNDKFTDEDTRKRAIDDTTSETKQMIDRYIRDEEYSRDYMALTELQTRLNCNAHLWVEMTPSERSLQVKTVMNLIGDERTFGWVSSTIFGTVDNKQKVFASRWITACNQLAIQTQLEASLDVYARTINDALTLSNPSATSNAVAISATSNAVAISGENSGENSLQLGIEPGKVGSVLSALLENHERTNALKHISEKMRTISEHIVHVVNEDSVSNQVINITGEAIQYTGAGFGYVLDFGYGAIKWATIYSLVTVVGVSAIVLGLSLIHI